MNCMVISTIRLVQCVSIFVTPNSSSEFPNVWYNRRKKITRKVFKFLRDMQFVPIFASLSIFVLFQFLQTSLVFIYVSKILLEGLV